MSTPSTAGYARLLVASLFMLLAVASASAQDADVEERDKIAQTTMKFLSVSADPRAAALGDAMTSIENGAHSLFTNPAGMAWQQNDTDLTFGQAAWIADIDYNHASFAYRPSESFGVIGVSLAFADYGNLEETIYSNNEQGFEDIGTFSPQAYAIGVGYARAFTDRFAAGGQVKYASMDFGDAVVSRDESGGFNRESLAEGVLAYDFGVFYRTGFESLNFALTARNFSQEVTFAQEGAQLPLSLRIGVSMDVLDLTPMAGGPHSLLLAVDAENPRDFSEQIKVGAEYTFAKTLSLRAGYITPADEQGYSLGAGVRQTLGGVGIGADYSFTDFGTFDAVHRVALHLSF